MRFNQINSFRPLLAYMRPLMGVTITTGEMGFSATPYIFMRCNALDCCIIEFNLPQYSRVQ